MTHLPAAAVPGTETRKSRADLVAAGIALGAFALAAVVGAVLYLLGHPVHASAAPLFAQWLPHAGPGTPLAVAVAVLVWWRGPELAMRLSWRRLSVVAYAVSVAWIFSLALVDGWQRGIAGRLTTEFEYLHEVPGITDVPAMLRGFSARIVDFQPDSWTTHVAGHPPGALLVFVGLDRLGLPGGAWAGLLCVLVAALTAVAIPRTLRLLGSDEAARASVPFLVLFPGAIWLGVSADGLFAGVAAVGLWLLASRRFVVGGLLLGCACYLSYGLVLLAPIALAVLLLARARPRAYGWTALGFAAVVVAFTVAGFRWWEGYHLVTVRYYQGLASHRPYAYWVWADLAVLAVSAGPFAAVVLRRAAVRGRGHLAAMRTATPGADLARWVLPLAAATAILAADVSGYSKAEVERIWLPFAVWLPAGAALVPRPDRRAWLAAQAMVALLVNHLLLTTW